MTSRFPMAPLGRVIRVRKEFIHISDTRAYKRCRVQLHAKGIVLRDIVPGSEIKTKEQQVCRSGEFLVAEIDAKVGGFGIVPDDLDGAIVSSHYFLFEVEESTLDRRFLDFFIRTPAFRGQVSAQGSTNYAAIRPDDVLGYTIPLQPLAEQRRIVARIEELAAKIEEARGLRQQAINEAEALLITQSGVTFERLSTRYKLRAFGTFFPHVTSGPRNWAKHYEQEGYRFYRAQDIGPVGEVLNDSKVFIAPPPGEQGRSAMLKTGDLMLV